MSTTVTYNANQYSVPAYNDTGYAQGAGNLSSYLVALATGSLTLAGGTFTLTADANFGANFGLVSLYYKSTTASIASAGQIRLAKTDSIQWRNNAGGGNLSLTIDGSDRLTFNGSVISAFGIPLPIADGGTNSTTALSNNRLIESLSGSIVESPTTITSAGANLILGTTVTTADVNGSGTAKNYVFGYSSNNTTVPNDLGMVIRNASTTANSTNGLHFSAASGSSGGNDFPIFASLVATAATRTSGQYPVGTLHFLLTQTLNTAPAEVMTLLPAGTLAILATTNQLTLGTTNTTTLSATAPSASRTYTIPDAGGAANVMLDKGNYTISGTWTSPTFITPALGTPASGALTSCTSIPVDQATGTLAVNHGGTNQTSATADTNYLGVHAPVDYSGTSSIVGWGTFDFSKTLTYTQIGKIVFVYFNLDGTSNSASTTFTLPFTCVAFYMVGLTRGCLDNGAGVSGATNCTIDSGTSTVTCYPGWTTGSWTASGRKRVQGNIWFATT